MIDRHVPSVYADIAAAVAAAGANDRIVLEFAGSPFKGANNKNIATAVVLTFQGEDGVVVDCEGAGRFLAPGAKAYVRNIEIKNGTMPADNGGAISSAVNDVDLNGVVFSGNYAQEGGAVYVGTGVLTHKNCKFRENYATSGKGGAIRMTGGSLSSVNALFYENVALTGGGAVATDNVDISGEYNTFVENSVTGPGGTGGALDVDDSVAHTTLLKNSILWGNSASVGTQVDIEDDTKTVATFTSVLSPRALNDIVGTLAADTDPLTSDPLFVDSFSDDYHLQQVNAGQAANSPAFNSGSEQVVGTSVEGKTTRTDLYNDTGFSDRGFHYVGNGLNPSIPISIEGEADGVSSAVADITKRYVEKGATTVFANVIVHEVINGATMDGRIPDGADSEEEFSGGRYRKHTQCSHAGLIPADWDRGFHINQISWNLPAADPPTITISLVDDDDMEYVIYTTTGAKGSYIPTQHGLFVPPTWAFRIYSNRAGNAVGRICAMCDPGWVKSMFDGMKILGRENRVPGY